MIKEENFTINYYKFYSELAEFHHELISQTLLKIVIIFTN